MNARYTPGQGPPTADQSLLAWLYREFSRIGSLAQPNRLEMTPVGTEPAKYSEGTVVYADGTEWNPGDGKGLYYWDGSAWVLTGAAGGGGVTDHAALTGRTAADQHPISAITDLQTTLDGKAASVHGHAISNITDLQATLDGKAASVHGHAISDVLSLQSELDGKAATSHTHTIANVTGLQTALDGKAATSHTHTIANVTGLQTALDGKEPGLGNPAVSGRVLASTTGGTRSWVDLPSGGGGGASWAHYTAEDNDSSLTSKTAVAWDTEVDPDGLASISGNDVTIAQEGWYLIHLFVDFQVVSSTSTTLRRFRTHLDWNDLVFWSISGEIPQYGTRNNAALHRPYYLYVNDQLNLSIEDDQGTIGTYSTNIYMSLLKLG